MNVLLVDDSPEILARLAAMLRDKTGARVSTAATAEDALSATPAPDVVVLDVHLPDRSGLDLLRQLKRDAPATVVIVLTNDVNDQNRRACLERGALAFLDKSSDFDHVAELVARASQGGP
jgi:DNA-binding NarL/FixJ family response regulator